MSPPPVHEAPVTEPPPPGVGFAFGIGFALGLSPRTGSKVKSRGTAPFMRAGVQYATTRAWCAAFDSFAGAAAAVEPGRMASSRNGTARSASLRERTGAPSRGRRRDG